MQKQNAYAHARQMVRARKQQRKLRVYLGRTIRDILRKAEANSIQLSAKLQQQIELAQRIFRQQRTDSQKVYSMHAPEVECIAKGKAHKKYEFGCKVSLAFQDGIYEGRATVMKVSFDP